jgi:hypothetical protein
MHLREYLAALFHGWVGTMSGIASLVLLFLPIAFPHYFSDSRVRTATWIAAGLCFAVANYMAWLSKRNELETEKRRHTGSDVRGEIQFGYLDWKKLEIEASGPRWVDLQDKCNVNLEVDLVNHSPTVARFRPEQTKLELRIGKDLFYGSRVPTTAGLAVSDPHRSVKRLVDFFAGSISYQGLKQGEPWTGNFAFITNLSPEYISAEAITANVKITLYDTLGKSHLVTGQTVPLLLHKLCLFSDVLPEGL